MSATFTEVFINGAGGLAGLTSAIRCAQINLKQLRHANTQGIRRVSNLRLLRVMGQDKRLNKFTRVQAVTVDNEAYEFLEALTKNESFANDKNDESNSNLLSDETKVHLKGSLLSYFTGYKATTSIQTLQQILWDELNTLQTEVNKLYRALSKSQNNLMETKWGMGVDSNTKFDPSSYDILFAADGAGQPLAKNIMTHNPSVDGLQRYRVFDVKDPIHFSSQTSITETPEQEGQRRKLSDKELLSELKSLGVTYRTDKGSVPFHYVPWDTGSDTSQNKTLRELQMVGSLSAGFCSDDRGAAPGQEYIMRKVVKLYLQHAYGIIPEAIEFTAGKLAQTLFPIKLDQIGSPVVMLGQGQEGNTSAVVSLGDAGTSPFYLERHGTNDAIRTARIACHYLEMFVDGENSEIDYEAMNQDLITLRTKRNEKFKKHNMLTPSSDALDIAKATSLIFQYQEFFAEEQFKFNSLKFILPASEIHLESMKDVSNEEVRTVSAEPIQQYLNQHPDCVPRILNFSKQEIEPWYHKKIKGLSKTWQNRLTDRLKWRQQAISEAVVERLQSFSDMCDEVDYTNPILVDDLKKELVSHTAKYNSIKGEIKLEKIFQAVNSNTRIFDLLRKYRDAIKVKCLDNHKVGNNGQKKLLRIITFLREAFMRFAPRYIPRLLMTQAQKLQQPIQQKLLVRAYHIGIETTFSGERGDYGGQEKEGFKPRPRAIMR